MLSHIEEDKLLINIESKAGISSITYNWNDEESQTIQTEEKTGVEKTLNIPAGQNTIYVSVIDINGVETKKEETFIVETIKPIINLFVVGNDIKITVTSEIELSEIRYSWNSEDEKKDNMLTYEERTKFEKKLEIPIGQNTLKIVAVDINGGQTEKTQDVKGITKAKTTTSVKGQYWHFEVNAKENIQKVEFEFNGKKFLMNKDTFGDTKKVHYKVKLVDGKNNLKIITTTESGGVDTTTWEKDYHK